jgi:hypothetical protein
MANGTSRKVDGVISDFEAFKSEVREKFDMQEEMLRELLQKVRTEVDPACKRAITQAMDLVSSPFTSSLPGETHHALQHQNWRPEIDLEEIQSYWDATMASMDTFNTGRGASNAPTPMKSVRPHLVNKRILPPPRFSGKKDSTVPSVKSWFTLLMQYFDLCNMDLLEHFMFWLTGKAQEWAADLFTKHKSGAQLLTCGLLKQKFMLQYGDAKRDTAMAARDHLHAHEHT